MTITGGTGAYADASGTLTFTTASTLIGARLNGACDAMNQPPKYYLAKVIADGSASL